jgi:putative transposase
MARPPRIDIPGLTYHVTNRGVKRLAVFHDDEDRQRFIRLLLIVREQLPFVIQDFSLMTNHFHLLLKTLKASLSEIMQTFTSRYAYWFNQKYDHVGHAFQSRFHSIPVQTDAYLSEVYAYIDLNAPRAGLVNLPQDYPWCGYRWIISGERNPIIDESELLDLFSEDRARARHLYKQFVEERLKIPERLAHELLLKKGGRRANLGLKLGA